MRESVGTIFGCVKHQKVITDDVLTLSKLEAGKVTCKMAPFDVCASVNMACKMFEAEMLNRSLKLELNLKEVTDLIVLGDYDRVCQVLM